MVKQREDYKVPLTGSTISQSAKKKFDDLRTSLGATTKSGVIEHAINVAWEQLQRDENPNAAGILRATKDLGINCFVPNPYGETYAKAITQSLHLFLYVRTPRLMDFLDNHGHLRALIDRVHEGKPTTLFVSTLEFTSSGLQVDEKTPLALSYFVTRLRDRFAASRTSIADTQLRILGVDAFQTDLPMLLVANEKMAVVVPDTSFRIQNAGIELYDSGVNALIRPLSSIVGKCVKEPTVDFTPLISLPGAPEDNILKLLADASKPPLTTFQ